ncbi:hypothetical protein ETD96_17140 [Actinomadura geliboluensis]|uniref:Uncharacterized protein n=1 Tax=Actinomadura geliboluensis TaxID=882440 RepID=A0A5S4GYT1_9ACTN|nr:hypothetical protein ETD96_17140 [Actinomadura geliboluensis]
MISDTGQNPKSWHDPRLLSLMSLVVDGGVTGGRGAAEGFRRCSGGRGNRGGRAGLHDRVQRG